jgi:hypothetical protein
MVFRASFVAVALALLLDAGCGRLGIQLLDRQAPVDAGEAVDATAPSGDAGAVDNDGSLSSDGASASDGSIPTDASGGRDGATSDGATSDGSTADASKSMPVDAGVRDAQVASCAPGFVDCDSTPLSCETQLGTIANCASCRDVCPANGGTATCNARSCATLCDASGTYAVKVVVALTWPAGGVKAGAGPSNHWFRFTGTQSGNNLVGSMAPCGITHPDFALNSTTSELYQLTFPTALFDHVPPYLASSPATLSSPTGFVLGGAFSMPTILYQAGANLSNPATDPWPSAATLPTVDTDGDGQPGVTRNYSNTGGYVYPPAGGTARADLAYTAARYAFSFSGTSTSCTELNGTSNFTSFDSHIVSCHIAGGATCTTAQRDGIDMGRPLFAPSSATMRAIKVAANSTCAAVRAALP